MKLGFISLVSSTPEDPFTSVLSAIVQSCTMSLVSNILFDSVGWLTSGTDNELSEIIKLFTFNTKS